MNTLSGTGEQGVWKPDYEGDDLVVVMDPEGRTAQSDAELVVLIREILATSPFHSEGHRKVRARLR